MKRRNMRQKRGLIEGIVELRGDGLASGRRQAEVASRVRRGQIRRAMGASRLRVEVGREGAIETAVE